MSDCWLFKGFFFFWELEVPISSSSNPLISWDVWDTLNLSLPLQVLYDVTLLQTQLTYIPKNSTNRTEMHLSCVLHRWVPQLSKAPASPQPSRWKAQVLNVKPHNPGCGWVWCWWEPKPAGIQISISLVLSLQSDDCLQEH